MNLSLGKLYEINYIGECCETGETIKATFSVRVIRQDATWTYGVIVAGQPPVALNENRSHEGEEYKFRSAYAKQLPEVLS